MWEREVVMRFGTLYGIFTSLSLTAMQLAYWYSGYQIHYGQWIATIVIPVVIGLFLVKTQHANKAPRLSEPLLKMAFAEQKPTSKQQAS